MATPNPLSATNRNVAPAPNPMLAHAQMWQHVNGMAPDEMATKAMQVSYGLPILGALAADPKVTRKDVIKAAADAAGAGKIPPSQAVEFISRMPDDPAKLAQWLRGLYATNLSAIVHMKAAMMPAPAAPVAPAAPQMPPGAPQP